MASPELKEMEEQLIDEEDERSSSAHEMPLPSDAGPSNLAPISIPISTISQDTIWDNLGKTVDQYWSDIKLELAEAPSQREYNRLIDFENRDLLIRELKHESLTLLNKMLIEYPTLREKGPLQS
ncbi:hypothetical protein Hanom_Chr09g00791541 [Helianthus anomalus]